MEKIIGCLLTVSTWVDYHFMHQIKRASQNPLKIQNLVSSGVPKFITKTKSTSLHCQTLCGSAPRLKASGSTQVKPGTSWNREYCCQSMTAVMSRLEVTWFHNWKVISPLYLLLLSKKGIFVLCSRMFQHIPYALWCKLREISNPSAVRLFL